MALVAGVLVLAGAVAAGHHRRVYDAVVLKVLGATRRTVAQTFLLEYGLLGLVTAAGSLGLLFPPSLPVVLYSVVASSREMSAPADQLYLGGLLPGLLLVVLVRRINAKLGAFVAHIG